MQAIHTKYIAPSNVKGARIKAACERGSLTVSYPYDLSGDACHIFARQALVDKFVREDAARYGSDADKNPWARPMACGQLPDGTYAHVFV